MLVLRDKRYFKENEAKDRKRVIQHENLAVIIIATLKRAIRMSVNAKNNSDILACYNVHD